MKRQAEDKAKAEAEAKAEEEACRKEIECWGEKAHTVAAFACPHLVERLAKFDFEWTDGWTEPKFSHFRWRDIEAGTVTVIGDKIKMQNGFGAWSHMIYECDIDPVSKEALATNDISNQSPQNLKSATASHFTSMHIGDSAGQSTMPDPAPLLDAALFEPGVQGIRIGEAGQRLPYPAPGHAARRPERLGRGIEQHLAGHQILQQARNMIDGEIGEGRTRAWIDALYGSRHGIISDRAHHRIGRRRIEAGEPSLVKTRLGRWSFEGHEVGAEPVDFNQQRAHRRFGGGKTRLKARIGTRGSMGGVAMGGKEAKLGKAERGGGGIAAPSLGGFQARSAHVAAIAFSRGRQKSSDLPSIPEIDEIEWQLDIELLDQRNGGLQVVALLAGDTQFITLDRHLHLDLAGLDILDQLARELTVDALAHTNALAHRLAGGVVGGLEIEHPGIDLAPGHVAAQQLLQLLELHFVIGMDGDIAIGVLGAALRSLEVVALVDLTHQIGNGVVDLGKVGFGNDIECGHGYHRIGSNKLKLDGTPY